MKNDITNDGPVLLESRVTLASGAEVLVRKLPDDPACLRASIGGSRDDGYYLVFRGDDTAVEVMLRAVSRALQIASGG